VPGSSALVQGAICKKEDLFAVADCFPAALPVILAHSQIITVGAMVMCIIGGLLIYGTIISFGMFFQEEQEF
jgi:hypothetical protein